MTKHWKGKTILISGGSQGLGLHLAVAAAREGAHLVVVGRNLDRLRAVQNTLSEEGAASVQAVPLDAKEACNSTTWLSVCQDRGIDLLLNVVGQSDRGSLEELEYQELLGMVETNVMTAWSMTKATLPLLERNRGCVVNVGSLAGLVATPNLGGYCVSKFALTALTRQWRMEWKDRGVHFLLVSPGPIAREDSHRRYDTLVQARGLASEGLKQPGGGAKLKLIDPEWLSVQILRQAAARKPEFVVPFKVRILASLMPLWTPLAEYLLAKNLRK